jgi:hypothetical protein
MAPSGALYPSSCWNLWQASPAEDIAATVSADPRKLLPLLLLSPLFRPSTSVTSQRFTSHSTTKMPKSYDDRSGKSSVPETSSRHTRRANDSSPEPARRSRPTVRSPEQSPSRDSNRHRRRTTPPPPAERKESKKSSRRGRDRSGSQCSSASSTLSHNPGNRSTRKGRESSPAQSARSFSQSSSGSAASSDVSSLVFSDDSVHYVPSRSNSIADGSTTEHRLRVFQTKTKDEDGDICEFISVRCELL